MDSPWSIVFPYCGSSQLFSVETDLDDRRALFTPVSAVVSHPGWFFEKGRQIGCGFWEDCSFAPAEINCFGAVGLANETKSQCIVERLRTTTEYVLFTFLVTGDCDGCPMLIVLACLP